jgi:glycosyltransferase involved in cell wall biosynthesis
MRADARPLKILIALPSQGVYGGMELFAIALAAWLRERPEFDVRICFKLVAGFTARDELKNRCAELRLHSTFCAGASLELVRNIAWADLVHANNCSPDIALAARVWRKPLVLTVHNWRRGGSLRHRLWKVAHDSANFRTYNSRFVMDSWLLGKAARDCRVIPTVTHFGPTPSAPLHRRGFLFIARWIEGKGLPELVEAYARADLDRERWPLTLAGDGPLRDRIAETVRAEAIAGISILGFVSEAEKYRRIANCKWLVCPPNTREDMGLTPIEARKLGVPSIVTVDGGIPESAGAHAIFCPPGNPDALARALELAAGLSEEAYRARCEGAARSLDQYLRPLQDYSDIYFSVLGKTSGVLAAGNGLAP